MDSISTYQEQTSPDMTTEDSNSKLDLVQKVKKSLYKQERELLKKVISQVRQVNQNQDFLSKLVTILQQTLKADRVLIYRFDSPDKGKVVAESLVFGWTPSLDEAVDCICFGAAKAEDYSARDYLALEDIRQSKVTPHQKQLLEKLQVQSSLAIPILLNSYSLDLNSYSLDKVWGLLVVQQCEQPRYWNEDEINLVSQLSTELTICLQQTAFIERSNFEAQQGQAIAQIVRRIQQSQDVKDIFRTATSEVRQLLNCDRVVVYQFKPDWSGEVLAESMTYGWTSVMELQQTDEELYSTEMNADSSCTLKKMESSSALDEDTYLKDSGGGDYTRGRKFNIVNDVYAAGFSTCYLKSLEKYQAKAYIIVPIFQEDRLWGLFAAYQNSGAREWQSNELSLMLKIAPQLGIAIEQGEKTERLRETLFRQQSLAKMVDRMRDAPSIISTLEIAAQEARKLLKVERSNIYRFNADWTGENVVEAPVDQDFKTILDASYLATYPQDSYPYLRDTQGGIYKEGKAVIVSDIQQSDLEDRLIQLLERLEVKAYVKMPIMVDKKLWGAITVYQSKTRIWQEKDLEFLKQIVSQVGIIIQQKQYLDELQIQTKQEQTIANIVQSISSAAKIRDIFRTSTKEVRKLLKVDRAVVYRFNPDWTGEVLAESYGVEWVSVMDIQDTDQELFSTEMNADERCTLKNMEAGSALDEDTYFIDTKGGNYTRGKKFNVVNDIYAADFSPCYLKSLEKYQARAYVIVPIFQENKLWGLFGVYQNSGPRNWKTAELNLLLRIAPQLGLAIEQTEKTEQLKINSDNLAQTVAREKAAREELQKQALDILKTVRPAFSGDLTVRAKVTETEIGTVAGAYNTTLDSLKDIVEQVQNAALQVTETTGSSSVAIKGLSQQSEKQLLELQEALDRVQSMINASTVTTENAQKVEVAIEQANQTVQAGDQAMNNTVDSIASIRNTVADAGKRVKRLSDSSQKISKVVSLISSFATQTNLLALNAALEATRAGEYGKGFAVVADEVRNLSLQSTEATTEIEKLVREIQEETQEVAAAMDAGVSQVAEGTNLVNETRDSLNEIVAATAEIKDLVQGITSAANAQTQEAASVTQVMGQVAEIANETSQDSGKISISFEQLEQLAQNLQASVSQFKVK
ncbi:MAG: GAF domain-containing protein [Cyanobacteria bacterium J06621_8]